MGRPRRAGHDRPPGVPQQARQFGGGIHLGGKFGHGGEQRRVRQLLVGVAMLLEGDLPAGQRDDRAAAEIGVLQPGREVGGTHRLREAQAGPAGDARIAVGHVDRGLFRMRQHPGNAEHAELDQRAAEHGIDPEHMGGAGGVDRARQPFGTGHRLGWRVGHVSSRSVSCAGGGL